jgi:hypothetical protein
MDVGVGTAFEESAIAGFEFQLHLRGPERVEGFGLWPSFGDCISKAFPELCRGSNKTEAQSFRATSVECIGWGKGKGKGIEGRRSGCIDTGV